MGLDPVWGLIPTGPFLNDSHQRTITAKARNQEFKLLQLKEYTAALRLHVLGFDLFPAQTLFFQRCLQKKVRNASKA
jgi:hypothetical protein